MAENLIRFIRLNEVKLVDPEKVIFRQIEFEYCGLSGLPG
jgi:hypothetical protein